VYIILVPVFIYYSSKNDYVKDALLNGWTPIIVAMLISSSGGFIMSFAVQVYKDIAVFQPVVNGVGGNLVAIFASRLSTALHRTSAQGTVPNWSPKRWYLYPVDTFFGKHNPESKTGCVLASLSIPGHLLFFFLITRIKIAQSDPINPACLTASFVLFYLFLLITQV
jgi:solute carrier family 41